MNKKVFNPISLFIIGMILGIFSKILDLNTEILGNIFSQLAIWILLGTIISIYSETKKKAMINIFMFCVGMLISYYITAEITNSVYGMRFIYGWIVFSIFSPIMAYFAWMTKEKGKLSRIISIGIVVVSFLSSIVLFDRLRFHDFIINAVLIYFLFIKKIKR